MSWHSIHAAVLCSIVSVAVVGSALFASGEASAAEGSGGKLVVYVGTYNGPNAKGIYEYEFNSATGGMKQIGEPAEITNSSFLAVHPNGKFLYSVIETENFRGKNSGGLKSFAIDPKSGKLTALNEQTSEGGIPCHLVIDPSGKHLLVANYNGGTFTCVAIEPDGKLGSVERVHKDLGSSVNKDRQEGPHPHGIAFDKAGKFFLVCDLGNDKVSAYRLETLGTAGAVRFEPAKSPFAAIAPGSGPRHAAFHPNGKFVYVVTEMAGTIAVLRYDAASGALHPLQTISTLPEDFKGNNTASAVVIQPSGEYLFACNRGDDSVVSYAVDSQTGKLKFVDRHSSEGKTPRDCVIDPSGKWLVVADQGSDKVSVFRIGDDGHLKATTHPVSVGAPGVAIFHQLGE